MLRPIFCSVGSHPIFHQCLLYRTLPQFSESDAEEQPRQTSQASQDYASEGEGPEGGAHPANKVGASALCAQIRHDMCLEVNCRIFKIFQVAIYLA
jgi:hypothetical protein